MAEAEASVIIGKWELSTSEQRRCSLTLVVDGDAFGKIR